MSDIPYSVRQSATNINKLRGFNFDTIGDNELLKKVDSGNVGRSLMSVNNVGAIGMNGDYGTAGSSLVSNGSTLAAVWEEKYYVQAELTTSFPVPNGNNYHTINLWTSDTVSSTSAGNDIGTTDWTCPADGIYRLSGYLSVVNDTEKLKNIELLIQNVTGAVTVTYIATAKKFTSYAKKTTLNFNRIFHLAQGNTIRFLVKAITNDGTDTFVRTHEWSAYTIERIKKEPFFIITDPIIGTEDGSGTGINLTIEIGNP